MDTFLSSIDRLIGKKGLITEYYSSPDSSFVLEEGKTMHKEDQVFIIKIEKIYPSPNIMFDMYISNY